MMFREEKKSFFGKMSQRIGDALAGKATMILWMSWRRS